MTTEAWWALPLRRCGVHHSSISCPDCVIVDVRNREREAVAHVEALAAALDGVVQRDVSNCTFLHSRERCVEMHTPDELAAARAWLGGTP